MPADDTALRKAIREKVPLSESGLASRVTRLIGRKRLMSRQQALYVIAHQEGIQLERFGVAPDVLVDIGRLVKEVETVDASAKVQSTNSTNQGPSRSNTRQVRLKAGNVDVGTIPTFVQPIIGAGHRRSADAYPLLSVFENSIRELVRHVLIAAHGSDWWEQGVPRKVRDKAARFMKDDANDPWHEPRGDHGIYYIGLWDYSKIITDSKNWPLFEPILDRKEYVTETLRGANVSRRVVAHMTGLDSDDRDHLVISAKKWLKLLKAREGLIP